MAVTRPIVNEIAFLPEFEVNDSSANFSTHFAQAALSPSNFEQPDALLPCRTNAPIIMRTVKMTTNARVYLDSGHN